MVDETEETQSVLRRVSMLSSLGRFQEASEMARDGVARDPKNALLYCEWSKALSGLEKYQEATHAAEQAITLAPTLPWAYGLRSASLVGQARRSSKHERPVLARDAVMSATECVRLAPHEVNGYLHLAQAQALADNAMEANDAVQEAIRLAPNSAAVWVTASLVALGAKHTDAAISASQKALSIDPQNYAAQNNLGVALQRAGRKREGNAVLARAAQTQPGFTTARRNLSRTGFNIARLCILVVLIPLGLVAHVGLLLYFVFAFGSNVYVSRHPNVIMRLERWTAPLALRFSKEHRMPASGTGAPVDPTSFALPTQEAQSTSTWSAVGRRRFPTFLIEVLAAAFVVTALVVCVDVYVNDSANYEGLGVVIVILGPVALGMVLFARRRRRSDRGR